MVLTDNNPRRAADHSVKRPKKKMQKPAKKYNSAAAEASLLQANPGLGVRLTAAKLLNAVVTSRTPLDGLTDNTHGHPHYLAHDDRDRALVRAILGSALRNRGTIQAALNHLLDRPLPENAVALQQLLHVAAAQILYLDIPDHAAVDLAVTAANHDPRNRRYAGLVNAILRRLTRNKERALQLKVDNGPEWYLNSLKASYGQDLAQQIVAIQAWEPAIDITVKSEPETWAQRLGGIVLPNGTVRLNSLEGALTDLPGFAEGQWWVQDAAASLPALLLGEIAGKRVADLCAAPGGKTAQLIMQGAEVTAIDISKNRLKRLQSNLDRLQLKAELIVTNILEYQPEELFDAVLLDAPCSSTGTIRRHPDVMWTKTPEDVIKLAQVQRDLLRHAASLIKPDGVIVFSNCSLNHEEGEILIEEIIAEGHLRLDPLLPQDLAEMRQLITEQGTLRSTPADLPHTNPKLAGMDGFFAARLRRLR